MCLRRILSIASLAVFFGFLGLPAHADDSLFGSNEVRSTNISSFTNWTGVMHRYEAMVQLGEGICATAAGGVSYKQDCAWDEWQHILTEYRDKDRLAQARGVNDEFNS